MTDKVNPYLPEAPEDGKHIFGENGQSYRCSRCGVYNRDQPENPPFYEPCEGGWAQSGTLRVASVKKWADDKAAAEEVRRDKEESVELQFDISDQFIEFSEVAAAKLMMPTTDLPVKAKVNGRMFEVGRAKINPETMVLTTRLHEDSEPAQIWLKSIKSGSGYNIGDAGFVQISEVTFVQEAPRNAETSDAFEERLDKEQPICRECRDNKHVNCDGEAWDFDKDEPTKCTCVNKEHGA